MRSHPRTPASRPTGGSGRPIGRGRTPNTAVPQDHSGEALGVLGELDPGMVVSLRLDGRGRVVIDGRELPFDARCAGAGLFSLEAPPDSLLVGVSFTGTPSMELPCDRDPDEAIRIDVAVTAAGSVHSQVHCDGGVAPVDGTAGGVVVDALHRVLGLAVPGPPPTLRALVAGMWLQQVLLAATDGRVPTWAEAAWAAVDPLAVTDAPAPTDPLTAVVPPSEEAVAAEMAELADGASWEDLRRAAAIGRMRVPQLDPEEAGWMDATMFARWMVDSFPPPAVATDRLERIGALDLADRVRSVLRRLDTES